MPVQFETTTRNARLDVITAKVGASGSLNIYSGTEPANCAAALASNTLLVSLPLSAVMAPAAVAGVLTLNAVTMTAAVATGMATFWRITEATKTTDYIQGLVVSTWVADTAVALGQQVSNNGGTYRCTTAGTTAAAGGPSGTGANIADGGAVWAYVCVGADLTINTTSIVVGGPVIITSFTLTEPGA